MAVPMNNFVKSLTKGGGEPLDAVVLQGYLATPEIVKTVAGLIGQTGQTPAEIRAADTALGKVLQGLGDDPARMYLSAKMDRYVDFDRTNDQIHEVPLTGLNQNTADFSTTVWLKVPRERVPPRQYTLVVTSDLAPDDGFVRGKLVEDFMADPAARAVWDEQGYAPLTGAKSRMYCT